MKTTALFQPFSGSLRSRQRGVVLLVALLFLIVLTLLGVGASRMVTSEERVSRYLREYNSAFQATEAALVDGGEDIENGRVGSATGSRIGPNTQFYADCQYGLCLYDPTELIRPWTEEAKWANATLYGTRTLRSPLPKSAIVGSNIGTTDAKDGEENSLTRYGGGLQTSAVTGVSQQPAYLIESIKDNRPGGDARFGSGTPPVFYRITARGFGADPNSRAMVQQIQTGAVSGAGL